MVVSKHNILIDFDFSYVARITTGFRNGKIMSSYFILRKEFVKNYGIKLGDFVRVLIVYNGDFAVFESKVRYTTACYVVPVPHRVVERLKLHKVSSEERDVTVYIKKL